MGAIILLFLLFFLLIISYRYLRRNLLSPSLQMIVMFMVGTLSYVFASQAWRTRLSFETVVVIFSALLFFVLGEFLSNKTKTNSFSLFKRKVTITKIFKEDTRIYIKPIVFLLFLGIGVLTVIGSFKYAYTLSVYAGNKYGISYMLNFVYYAKYNLKDIPQEPQYVTFGAVITECFATISLFVFFANNKIKLRKRVIYLAPLLLHAGVSCLNSGRTWILRVLITIFTLYLYFVLLRNGKKNVFKVLILAGLFGIAFVLLYHFLGVARQSLTAEYETIFAYPASPIEALNEYIASPVHSDIFGKETLITIKIILNKLGFNFDINTISLETVSWNGYETNIYTSIRRYIADYTFIGMLAIQLIIGFIYGRLNKRLLKTKSISYVLVYSMIMYPIIESLFEERFFLSLLSAGTIYIIVLMPIMSTMIKEKKCKQSYYKKTYKRHSNSLLYLEKTIQMVD